ncbi:DUF92 domain-containing protein [Picrophilus oshimae]|uniref:Hypothetical membrane spanning protein n=1 Tax=Picrophilus torridus (strain ATCC 700027 / DSM 9790 / JCM 10055 / NBRC 100828 / KAW 2/3) TaxID=1122961 RepID=Q6L2D7_PICTO|nr:DUF92 domain-containing protein [Picrophilus oshimae]AAT42865.1 hypothetical membrane spanning protein [Picrophilus oshimae DSM 9789]SMD31626.1 TIGR00297 family protein [Picrophilus oshimae DSM 9789]
MVINEFNILYASIILIALFIVSRIFNVFDLKGSISALFVGYVIAIAGSLYWLILMIVFAMTSYIATRFKIKEKTRNGLQEGKNGERKTSNVMYAAMIGLIIALFNVSKLGSFNYFELFAISFATVNSDTFASELGVFDKNVFLITNFKRVRPGTNGGISLLGESSALFGSFIIGLTYSLLMYRAFFVYPVLVITLLGFLGCQVDSILGSLLENRGRMSKGQVNLTATLISVVAGVAILM